MQAHSLCNTVAVHHHKHPPQQLGVAEVFQQCHTQRSYDATMEIRKLVGWQMDFVVGEVHKHHFAWYYPSLVMAVADIH